MAVLQILKGSSAGQFVELTGERTVFGRHPQCKIVLDNAAVSRNHAQILESHGSYFLEDLRSRNGTKLNGSTIGNRVPLTDEDEIQVCDMTFRFFTQRPGPAAAGGMTMTTRVGRPLTESGATRITDEVPEGGRAGDDDFILADESSVLSKFDVSSLQNLRLAIRPEAKLRAVLAISASLGKSLKLGELLPKVLSGLFGVFPQADRGLVLLKDHETGKVQVRAMRFRQESADESPPVSRAILDRVLTSKEAILSENASQDGRFESSESIANLRLRSMICAPLVDPEGTAVGAIQLDSQDSRFRFTPDDLDLLASLAPAVALAVDNAALHEDALRRRDIERELEFATEVQLGFLPTSSPEVPGYRFFDFYEAALRVGGDLFDYIPLPDGRLAVVVGDVAGKGVPAALLMARMYSMARYHLISTPRPADALTVLNKTLSSSGLGHRFITFVAAVLDPVRHEVTLVNAGHQPPLLRHRDGQVQVFGKETSGLPLGVKGDYDYQQYVIPLAPGELLLLCTDGVNDAMNRDNQIFGLPRIISYLAAATGPVEQVGEGLVNAIETFSEGHSQSDDICIVALRRE